jgi:hypothetical protein
MADLMAEEIAVLKAKIKARQGKLGFASNVAALKARLAELEGAE